MDLEQAFNERLQEIDAYINLLEALERHLQTGAPKIGGTAITAQQQKILYSSVYLQLYNLVEATVTWCVDAVVMASTDGGRWKPGDLIERLRREWIRASARTHVELSVDNRLNTAVAFCDQLLQSLPVQAWSVEKGGGGSWDDKTIEAITDRIGCELHLSPAVRTAVKRHVKDDRGALALVKYLRNQLAHGEISFEQCGDGITVTDLKQIRDSAALYLKEVVLAFKGYIDNYHFIAAHLRPSNSGGGP